MLLSQARLEHRTWTRSRHRQTNPTHSTLRPPAQAAARQRERALPPGGQGWAAGARRSRLRRRTTLSTVRPLAPPPWMFSGTRLHVNDYMVASVSSGLRQRPSRRRWVAMIGSAVIAVTLLPVVISVT